MSLDMRQFSVCASERDPHAARPVAAVSFEAAALAYAEDAHLGAAAQARLIVRDLESGAEQVFLLHYVVDCTTPDPI